MTKPILDDSFWEKRLKDALAIGEIHRTVFECSHSQYLLWHNAHKQILAEVLKDKPTTTVIDFGCGYGRVYDILPDTWRGYYLGIDRSPTLIKKAQELHPYTDPYDDNSRYEFICCDIENLDSILNVSYTNRPVTFDIGITASMEQMIKGNLGNEYWERIEKMINKYCKQRVNLEYEPYLARS
jgi:SAM-dependent methyltransferase